MENYKELKPTTEIQALITGLLGFTLLITVILIYNFLNRRSSNKVSYEQALILHIKVSDDEFGAELERTSLMEWERGLLELIKSKIPGATVDGNEFGGGFCKFYLYGANIDEVESLMLPELNKITVPNGSYYYKRYGDALDPNAKKIHVHL